MRLTWGALLIVLGLFASSAGCGGSSGPSAWEPPPPTTAPDDAIAAFLEGEVLPALAVAVVDGGETLYRKVAGVRKRGDATPVTDDDAFHIGSNTKAMTALLVGTAVDAGQLTWETTVGATLSGTITVGEAYRDVTLTQLLSHTSGMPDALKPADWASFFDSTAPVAEERRRMAELALARPPASTAGSAFLYSNFNYVVAGLMLEVATGQSWEALMAARLFAPLAMTQAGFGPPASPGMVDGPWGHTGVPVDPGSLGGDNPPAMGPAGTVHASLDDILGYIRLYFDDGVGPAGPIVSHDVLVAMETPHLNDYGFGWLIGHDASDRVALAHDGSNTMFYAVFILIPERKAAIIIMTNAGNAPAVQRVAALWDYLAAHFGI